MKVILGSIILFGFALAGSTTPKIQCYVGTDPQEGFNSAGDITVTDKDKTVCFVMTTVGKPGAIRAGAILEDIIDEAGQAAADRANSTGMDIVCKVVATKFCLGEGYSKCQKGVIEKTCFCLTDLCNNASSQVTAEATKPSNNNYCNKAPAITGTPMPFIAMALVAKFGF